MVGEGWGGRGGGRQGGPRTKVVSLFQAQGSSGHLSDYNSFQTLMSKAKELQSLYSESASRLWLSCNQYRLRVRHTMLHVGWYKTSVESPLLLGRAQCEVADWCTIIPLGDHPPRLHTHLTTKLLQPFCTTWSCHAPLERVVRIKVEPLTQTGPIRGFPQEFIRRGHWAGNPGATGGCVSC